MCLKEFKNILIKIKRGWICYFWIIYILFFSFYVLFLYNIGIEWLKFFEVELIWKIIKWYYINILKDLIVEF